MYKHIAEVSVVPIIITLRKENVIMQLNKHRLK